MGFRKKRSEWAKFVRCHSRTLDEIGIPDVVYQSESRFYVFLHHGYDEVGWSRQPHGYTFYISGLPDESLARLKTFVRRRFGEGYPAIFDFRPNQDKA